MQSPLPVSVVLAAPMRTPIGKFGGSLANKPAPELGAVAVRATLARAGLDPAAVSQLIFGNARSAGVGPNPARQVGRLAGLPDAVPAWTVNQACASGMRCIINGVQSVALGESRVVVAGGTESMSRVPYLLSEARWGRRLGHTRLTDGMYRDGFLCPLCGLIMGETAENLADSHHIGRDEQDTYAVETQRRAEEARQAGRFEDEIAPVVMDDAGTLFAVDEHPRAGMTVEKMAKLKPVFRRDGTVHAGNSSGITDGAAAVLVMTEETAGELGVEPYARVVAWETAGVDPATMGIGPVPAVRRLLERTGLGLDDIELIELNEAFAVQVLACMRDLGLDPERLNVNGGAIALGHPIGATGARITVTLLHEMRRRQARRGIAALCVSGGLGQALLVELV